MKDARVIEEAMHAKGYAVFTDTAKGYDLNIFGIRTTNNDANTFNDTVGVMYLYEGRWCCFLFPATTDPGVYYRENPMNVDGTAILVPGQYRGAYKIGEHKHYPALVQKKAVKVYRDNDEDKQLDMKTETVKEGYFGINIHRANSAAASTLVNKWSAGCQVIADPYQFEFLMSLCHKAASLHGNGFTYTLLTEDDFA